MKLTEAQTRELERGAAHPDGVIAPSMPRGWARKAWERRMGTLVANGLAEANAHGDFYITDVGRITLGPIALTGDGFRNL